MPSNGACRDSQKRSKYYIMNCNTYADALLTLAALKYSISNNYILLAVDHERSQRFVGRVGQADIPDLAHCLGQLSERRPVGGVHVVGEAALALVANKQGGGVGGDFGLLQPRNE